MEGGTGAERSRDGVGDEDLLCGAGGVGAGDGGDVVHHVGIVIFGDEAEAISGMPWPPVNPPLRAWLSNGSTATIRTSFVQALSVSPTPGDGACAAHADHDAGPQGLLPSRAIGFGDGRGR